MTKEEKIVKALENLLAFRNASWANEDAKAALAEYKAEAQATLPQLPAEGDSDSEHLKACRIAVLAYADAIEHRLTELAKELRERYSTN